MKRTAEISDCGKYRWWLQRRWAPGPIVTFVMLNPSTADAVRDDPTIRKCIRFAKLWGFSALAVRNLFAWRATDPRDLAAAIARGDDVAGGDRGDAELLAAKSAGLIVAAYGGRCEAKARAKWFIEHTAPKPIWAIDYNLDGSPTHPLFLKPRLNPKAFARCSRQFWSDALKEPCKECGAVGDHLDDCEDAIDTFTLDEAPR
jgi:hypothetical protein